MIPFCARRALPVVAIAVLAAAAAAQAPGPKPSELTLDASLIEEFVRVAYFGPDGRYHFREYSTCSYQFLQNPDVRVEDGLVRISAEYYSQRGTEARGGCVGSPRVSTNVLMTVRLLADGSNLELEVTEVTTDTLPEVTSVILGLVGVQVPMTHRFDLMAALNSVLQNNQPFGIVALDVHEVVAAEGTVTLQVSAQLGLW